MLNIKNLKEQKKEGNITLNMIVYGDSGVGKTTLAASASEVGKVLYIDAESGAQFIPDEYAKNIDVLNLQNIEELDQVLLPANTEQYSTIVLDSITEIMKKMIDKIKGTKDNATIADWQKIIGGMEKYFRRFRDLKQNIILVALSAEKEDDGIILKRPNLSGKNLPADVVGFMDVCIYLENTVAQGRVGHTDPSQKFYAKDRTNKLPKKIEQKDLKFKTLLDLVTIKPEPLSKEMLKTINNGIKDLKLEKDDIVKMAKYGGADIIEELTLLGAEKVIKAIDLKLSSKVETPKETKEKKEKKEIEKETKKDKK